MTDAPAPQRPQRIAAAWFLGVVVVLLAVVAWLRGAGRFVAPVLLAVLVGVVIVRIVKAIVKPVD